MKLLEKTKAYKTALWILFYATIVATYFFALDLPLIGPDEPRYAQVAKEMYERGDFITPTLGGFEWFEKPALLYWLQISSYSIFGVSEFSARFGSALLGLLTILFVWIFGKNISKTTEFANWLGLVAATSIGLIVFSRGASFDIILTFPITASLVSFFIAVSALENENPKASSQGENNFFPKGFALLFCFYFFTGVALLAKGLVGIIFPFAVPTLFYLLQRKLPPKKVLLSIPFGVAIVFLVAGLWYFPMYERHGWKFIDEFIIQHHFERYTSNKYLHPQPFWFFWVVLPLMMLPWTPFFLMATWSFLKKTISALNKIKSSSNPQQALDFRAELFVFCWLIVPLVFFSFSGSKLPGYILPSLPPACILTANYLHEIMQKHQRVHLILRAIALVTLLAVVIALKFLVADLTYHETLKPLLMKANDKGYSSNKILTLHTIAHNLEFYATERLVRTAEGKQRYFYGVAEVAEFMRLNKQDTVLVLVPLRYEKELIESSLLKSEKLGDNGEFALFVVSVLNN
ncbi:MAG: glycosyltransferase family 39 protein [Acidobacteria bacterium]|jgi:4-amino-4-deoxy-L-arabinose transferase-like glycosyltransferase|nr:MAG: glycosyltransferase family 39 protein [Acidobacteriota bacterium]GIU81078.1 MAG: hypothetical protein KatS3mg006_0142 [Pyrinomonadaceae bacterium]